MPNLRTKFLTVPQRPAVPLADDDNHLALARAVCPQAAILAIFAAIGWLHVAAEIAAINLGFPALAADFSLPNL